MRANIRPTTKDALDLFHQGSLALAEAEYNGIRCDRDYCQQQIASLERQIGMLKTKLESTELGRVWRKRYGHRLNWESDAQLRQVLYTDMGLSTERKTKGGKSGNQQDATSAAALEELGRDDVRLRIKMGNLAKMKSTYLSNLLYESEADGYVHPFFHLSDYGDFKSGGARSYRGSSSDPNFQNMPNRHMAERKLIRRAFLPRPGHRLVGRDYSSMEFRISACLHHDPNMIRYIEHGDDPHRDVAAHCFLLEPELCTKKYGEYGKNVRHVGKNGATFAQMYFQEPTNTAKGLWNGIRELDLRVPNDPEKSLYTHLKDKGLRTYESFERHIVSKAVPWFWQDMFPAYGKWRERWIADYDKRGWFDMLTGFRLEGVVSKYMLGNYPIQGPSFHVLLKALILTWQLWKSKSQWQSKIVGQIHDELTTDEHDSEFAINQQEVVNIMENKVREEWDWIIIPLSTETKASPVNGNWFEQKEI